MNNKEKILQNSIDSALILKNGSEEKMIRKLYTLRFSLGFHQISE